MDEKLVLIKLNDPREMGLGSPMDPGSKWVARKIGDRVYMVDYERYKFKVYQYDLNHGLAEIVPPAEL